MYLFNFVETMDPVSFFNPAYSDANNRASENPLSVNSIHNYIEDIYRTQVLSCHNPGEFLCNLTAIYPL